jgi:hypothetical protein
MWVAATLAAVFNATAAGCSKVPVDMFRPRFETLKGSSADHSHFVFLAVGVANTHSRCTSCRWGCRCAPPTCLAGGAWSHHGTGSPPCGTASRHTHDDSKALSASSAVVHDTYHSARMPASARVPAALYVYCRVRVLVLAYAPAAQDQICYKQMQATHQLHALRCNQLRQELQMLLVVCQTPRRGVHMHACMLPLSSVFCCSHPMLPTCATFSQRCK